MSAELDAIGSVVNTVGTPSLAALWLWTLYVEPRLRKMRASNGQAKAATGLDALRAPQCEEHGRRIARLEQQHAERITRLEEQLHASKAATDARLRELKEQMQSNHKEVCRQLERLADRKG